MLWHINENLSCIKYWSLDRSMDHHLQSLENLCRICGSRFSRNAGRRYLCIHYAEIHILEAVFGVMVHGDAKDVHLESFCLNCFASMNLHKDRLKANSSYFSTLSPRQWSPHAEYNCITCQLHDIKAKGGWPKKTKHLDRPLSNPLQLGSSVLVHKVRITMQQVPSFRGSMSLQLTNFAQLLPPLSLEHFKCKVCGSILDQPVELNCCHTFCGNCLVQKVNSGNCQCLVTTYKHTITTGGNNKPSELLMASLGALQYHWELYHICAIAKFVHPFEPLHRSTFFPSKRPHTISQYAATSSRCA